MACHLRGAVKRGQTLTPTPLSDLPPHMWNQLFTTEILEEFQCNQCPSIPLVTLLRSKAFTSWNLGKALPWMPGYYLTWAHERSSALATMIFTGTLLDPLWATTRTSRERSSRREPGLAKIGPCAKRLALGSLWR